MDIINEQNNPNILLSSLQRFHFKSVKVKITYTYAFIKRRITDTPADQ